MCLCCIKYERLRKFASLIYCQVAKKARAPSDSFRLQHDYELKFSHVFHDDFFPSAIFFLICNETKLRALAFVQFDPWRRLLSLFCRVVSHQSVINRCVLCQVSVKISTEMFQKVDPVAEAQKDVSLLKLVSKMKKLS